MNLGKHQLYERRALGSLIAATWLLLQIQGCAEVPITHRKGLHLAPETDLHIHFMVKIDLNFFAIKT